MSRRKPAPKRRRKTAKHEPSLVPVDYERAIRLVAHVHAQLVSALAGLSTPEDAQWLTPIARTNVQLASLLNTAKAGAQ